jgi:hypothetical protein
MLQTHKANIQIITDIYVTTPLQVSFMYCLLNRCNQSSELETRLRFN